MSTAAVGTPCLLQELTSIHPKYTTQDKDLLKASGHLSQDIHSAGSAQQDRLRLLNSLKMQLLLLSLYTIPENESEVSSRKMEKPKKTTDKFKKSRKIPEGGSIQRHSYKTGFDPTCDLAYDYN